MMTEYREKLVDRMIHLYGFENDIVIAFCGLCERWEVNSWNDKCLMILVEAHEADPVMEED